MGEVIPMHESNNTHAPIKPKSESRTHNGHRFVLRFDPHAPEKNRWHWTLKFTRVFEYRGSGPTIEAAAKAAKKQIEALEERVDRTG